MTGTVTVTGEPVPTTTATATPTETPSPTPVPRPSDPHTVTPAPGGTAADSVKPTVAGVKLTSLRRAVRVRFALSEPATVTVRVKRKRSLLKTARVQAPAGARNVTLRSSRLTKGRYTVEIEARDGYGNRSTVASKRLTVRK
jgi:hypothetical protein